MKLTQTNLMALAILVGSLLVAGAYYAKPSLTNDQLNNVVVTQSFESITPAQFADRIEKGVTVIDIRTQEEITDGKVVDSALEMDYYNADFPKQLAALDKDGEYLIYCRSGNRSAETLKLMKSLGFTNVSDLKGGKNAWESSGRKLVMPAKS